MFTQAGRPIYIESCLPPDSLLLESFDYEESISRPYILSCVVLVPDAGLSMDVLLRTAICVHLKLEDGSYRPINGFVRSVQLLRSDAPFLRFRLEAVPLLWFLTLNRECRIFQRKNVREIVTKVLKGYSNLETDWKLVHTYPDREYCVQYRESDYQFVSRLLEEEGISYFFRHTAQNHVLVFADSRAAVRPCAETALRYDVSQEAADGYDAVFELEHRSIVQTRQFALTDYNFLTPSRSLLVSAGDNAGPQQFDYPGKFADTEDGSRYARIRLEEEEAARDQFHGKSWSRQIQSGFRFSLVEHPLRRMNQAYTVVSVRHQATDQSYVSKPGADADYVYRNEWRGIPELVTYRPPRETPRPKVEGPQTARVVGAKMDYPDTETHGRVKLHFFWDRYGRQDGSDTCWIRVSQPWAGRDWGTISIPRVGQEVIVDFLEGDPDRPIITGRVYNEEMRPPYPLPAGAVNMGMKSKSIGGGGYNEISLNDTNTGEGIVIHAQKDMSTVVENNETVHIKNCRTETVEVDETITVNNNRTEKVAVNETIDIGNNRSEKVGVNEDIKIGSNRSTNVGLNELITIGLSRTQSVGINEMINIGAAQQLTVGGLRLVNVGLAQMVNVGLAHKVWAGYEMTLDSPRIVLTATKELKLTCGGGTITIDSGGNITITGTMVKINS